MKQNFRCQYTEYPFPVKELQILIEDSRFPLRSCLKVKADA